MRYADAYMLAQACRRMKTPRRMWLSWWANAAECAKRLWPKSPGSAIVRMSLRCPLSADGNLHMMHFHRIMIWYRNGAHAV